MTPVRNGTTRNSKNIYSELKDMIQFLDLKPGQAISESQLCASLGVSRTPVREALIRLADEKLVCFFPQSGTYVTRIDLDYIKELGVDYIWMTPFFVSPQYDNGYDVEDYYNIDPRYGTMEDFEEAVKEANRSSDRILWIRAVTQSGRLRSAVVELDEK